MNTRYGRSDRIRTCGLLVPNQAHYQAVPHPDYSIKDSNRRPLAPEPPRCREAASRRRTYQTVPHPDTVPLYHTFDGLSRAFGEDLGNLFRLPARNRHIRTVLPSLLSEGGNYSHPRGFCNFSFMAFRARWVCLLMGL